MELEFQNLIRVLDEYREEFETLYKYLEENEPASHGAPRKASGNLLRSVQTTTDILDTRFQVRFVAENYWRYNEEGRGPSRNGGVPYHKILEWVEIKPVLPHEDEKGHLPTQEQLAWMIKKKIDKEGYQGLPLLQMTIDQLNDKYIELLKEALAEDFKTAFLNLLISKL